MQFWQTSEGLAQLRQWKEQGWTNVQIAKQIGISTSTLSRWEKKYPEIYQALQKKQDEMDKKTAEKAMNQAKKQLEQRMEQGLQSVHDAVQGALLQRALGYEYTEIRTEITEKGEKTVKTVKHAPPDTTAQMLWLKNYYPAWQEKPDDKPFEITITVRGE